MVPPASHRISRVPRYSGSDSLPSPSPTGLSPSLVTLSRMFGSAILGSRLSSTPRVRRLAVWPLTSSLATTKVIEFSFFSSGYLDVSLPRVPSCKTMDSSYGDRALPRPGSPIRISPDQCLFAAPRSFSQLIASFVGNQCHWHPPCALVRLICLRLLDSPLALSRSLPSAARDFASPVFARPRCLLRLSGAAGTFLDRSVSFLSFPCAVFKVR